METRNRQYSTLQPLLAGGLMFALVGLVIDVQGHRPGAQQERSFDACQGDVRPDVVLSREQLAQVLTVPERDSRARIREIASEPYCQLPSIEVRYGVSAERDVYPLEFDPKTWLVVLYEGDEYAGYRFSFQ